MAQTIVENQPIILSKIATEALITMLENPPEPNENLKKAMQRRKEMLSPK